MKLIIAGTRNASVSVPRIREDIESLCIPTPTTIVSGGAIGIDACGERYAKLNGIEVVTFTPDWNLHGKAAGPIRNRKMAEFADRLIAYWDGRSPGTRNMIETMNALGKPVDVFVVSATDSEVKP